MLQHLYALNYSGSQESSGGVTETSFISELHTHVQMYALGDEYDIKDLKMEASRNLQAALREKGHNDEVTAVLNVIPAIYTTTPDSDRGLRDLVAEFGAQHMERMKDRPELEDVVVQAPKFLFEAMPRYFRRLQDKKEQDDLWHCKGCSNNDFWKYRSIACDWCGSERILTSSERIAPKK